MSEKLDVWYDGMRVAELTSVGLESGASLRYTDEAISVFGKSAQLLSVRLPVRAETYPAIQTDFFLDGLLPEDHVRASLADRARVSVGDTFGLLRAYGMDCAGAVKIIDPAESPESRVPGTQWLNPGEVARAVAGLPAAPLGIGIGPGVRSSLGGLQGKLAVVMDGSNIGIPLDGAPSTHILKPSRLDGEGKEQWPGIPAAEVFGLRTIQACHSRGVSCTAADAEVIEVGRSKAILVRRFDRATDAQGQVRRVHQEDFGQALGVRAKYQYDPTSAPRLVDVASLLQDHATQPAAALRELLEMLFINIALGNCDMHIRNISLLLDGSSVRLTPAYDVVPTAVWADQTQDLSLHIGGEAFLEDVTAKSFLNEAEKWGMRRKVARSILESTAKALKPAIDDVMDQAVSQKWHHPILDSVHDQTLKRIQSMSGFLN